MAETPPLHIVILAAGKGRRMHSRRPKVLQPVGGRAMLAHVLDVALDLPREDIHVVYGSGGDQVRAAFAEAPVRWVEQPEQLGTGDAVARALPGIPDEHRVLVLMGDQPLLTAAVLAPLIDTGADCAVLTMEPPDPHGYGRIRRDASGAVQAIVEEADASPGERDIGEVNTGILMFAAAPLRGWLAALQTDNRQGEHYLTDAVAMAVTEGRVVEAHRAQDYRALLGANDLVQLAELERHYQRRRIEALMRAGVRMAAPDSVVVRGQVDAESDTFLDVGVVIEGDVSLGEGTEIGPYTRIADSRLAAGTRVLSHSVLEGVVTEGACTIGPFARLRPGTVLGAGVKIGNFVETKKARFGAGAQASHLSYLGDASLGRDVNVGAGTITCNYDGVDKHQTHIGDGAFIGSDSQLVAPVTVGAGAYIGAGSTITRDAPAGQLTLCRGRQRTVSGWKPPQKERD